MGGDGFGGGSVHRKLDFREGESGSYQRVATTVGAPYLRPVDCQRLVLVGDAHLGRESPTTTDAFLAFLDAAPTLGDGLLVTGDLFEFWFTYRRAIPRHGARVMAALAALRRKMPVAMIGGNHDRWGGDFWRELEIEFAPHEFRFTLGGAPAAAIHGDGITALDWPARVLHRITRHPATIAIFGVLHPNVGMWLVDRMSGPLGDRPRPPAAIKANTELQARWAEEQLRSNPEVRLLVMGHTHQPASRTYHNGQRYLNPGAFCMGHAYALADDSTIELKQFT